MKQKQYKGAITALVTPFTTTGKVDMQALKNLVRFQLKGGIHGLVPCGSTGEAATLHLDEYELIVKTVVEEVKGRVPIIAGAGSNDTQKAILFSKIAQKAGADALLHVTPYYNKPTPSGLVAHFQAIRKAVDLPIILYNVPGRTGSNTAVQTVLDITKRVDGIVGIKEASGNIVQMMELIKDAPKGFSVLSGDDVFTLPLLSVGGMGCISVVANETPKEFSKLVEAGLERNFEKARKIHYQLFDLMQVNFIESNPIPVKTALSLMGKIEEVFRLPLVPIAQKNREVLTGVLKKQGLI